MDVEAELTALIGQMGGVHVRTVVGDSPPFENADFLFREDRVVAELKSLDEDKIVDDRVIEAATALYLAEMKRDATAPVIFGEARMSTEGRSQEFASQIAALYEKPIKGLVEKANRQIRATAKALGIDNAQGLLLVANNRHSALDPSHAHYLLQKILRRQSYSKINTVLYFSAGQRVALPGLASPVDVVLEIRRDNQPPVAAAFIAKFRTTWYQCLAKHRGADEHHEVEVNHETLHNLENRGEA